MLSQFIRRLFSTPSTPAVQRSRLTARHWPAAIYAIGDVHGCRDELNSLEALIVADAADIEGEKWIVMLGDYVDRGPRSAAVLDTLCAAPPADFRRICLAGNHEVMMLEFLDAPRLESDWLRFGGIETLASYGIDLHRFRQEPPARRKQILQIHIPEEHIELLASLPLTLALPDTLFVHAGIRPGIRVEEQVESDLLWIRDPFLANGDKLPFRVIHGHTPSTTPDISGNRIGIDTGAFATGILTALRIRPDGSTAFLNTSAAAMRGYRRGREFG